MVSKSIFDTLHIITVYQHFTNLHNLTETAGVLSFALFSNLRGSIGAEFLDLSYTRHTFINTF